MHSNLPVAVIGAGPCGLAVCKALGEFGIAYECLEASEAIGGIWNVGVRTGGYRSLTSNTSNPNMAYSDFPFAPDDGAYLKAGELLDYFHRYADHFGLKPHIRLGTGVTAACHREDGSWDVTLASGEERRFGALAVATGQYSDPVLPHASIPGEFSGQHLHVHDYYDVSAPVDMRDKRVLVVGLGTSAAEVAAELSDPESPQGHAGKLLLSARSGRWVLPKLFDGVPMDARAPHAAMQPPSPFHVLPAAIGSWVMRRVMGKNLKAVSAALGGASSLGLPEPESPPWAERPTLSFDFIPALRAGRIDVRPEIERFSGTTVHFRDGSETDVDVILYATGYRRHLPFLDVPTLGGEPDDLRLYRRIAHPSVQNLFFIGFCRVMCSLWPVAEQQSRWLARLLSGHFALPVQAVRQRRAIALSDTLPVMCNMYVHELRKEAGAL